MNCLRFTTRHVDQPQPRLADGRGPRGRVADRRVAGRERAVPLGMETAARAAVLPVRRRIAYWQPENLNDAMRVLQLNVPFAFRYSVVNQNVQSSTGSIDIDA